MSDAGLIATLTMNHAAREVVASGVEIVAVTLGERGAFVVTEKRAVRAYAPKVEVTSKVGAGDEFRFCLLACQHKFLDKPERYADR